jgi:hypothetical protein
VQEGGTIMKAVFFRGRTASPRISPTGRRQFFHFSCHLLCGTPQKTSQRITADSRIKKLQNNDQERTKRMTNIFNERIKRICITKTKGVIAGTAMIGTLLVTPSLLPPLVAPAAAAEAIPAITRESNHKLVKTLYFPDDICGPRGGWTTFVVTDHLIVTDLGDSLHVVFGEHGTYSTIFDDPAIENYSSQFTDAQHFNITRGGTVVFTEQFHDFPGTIRIQVRIVFVEVGGEVHVERFFESVTGCP